KIGAPSCMLLSRPPKSLPAARRLATESVIRSRLISNSICANAAITVNTIDPIGVEVSTSPPPRLSTRNQDRDFFGKLLRQIRMIGSGNFLPIDAVLSGGIRLKPSAALIRHYS